MHQQMLYLKSFWGFYNYFYLIFSFMGKSVYVFLCKQKIICLCVFSIWCSLQKALVTLPAPLSSWQLFIF
jgi:hypothetical protein